MRDIQDLEKKYELELDKIVEAVKKTKAKKVILQFPDGIKPYATLIVDELEKLSEKEKLKVDFFIWLGSCYGACDIPNVEDFDLIVNFGHSEFKS